MTAATAAPERTGSNEHQAPAVPKVRRGRPKGSGAILSQEERKERRRLNNRRAAQRSTARKMGRQAELEAENDTMKRQLDAVKQIFSVYQRLEDGHPEEEIERTLKP